MAITFDFGVAPFVDDSKKREVTIPYPATLAGVNYTKNPDLWSYYPSFSIWTGKVMNGETFNDPEIVTKLHNSFQLGLHSSAGIPKDPIAIDNGHSSYKDLPQGAVGYIVDTAVINGNEVIDIIQGQEVPRKSPEDTKVLMLSIAWLPSGLQAIASGTAPSISISMDVMGENVILRQPGLVTRPADNWIPKLVAFEEKEATTMPENKEESTKKFMDSNSPVMQAWLELLASMDDATGQAILDKIKAEMTGTPETPMEKEAFAVDTPLTKADVEAMITNAISGLTAQPVATLPPAPTEGMLTARFEAADLPFEIGEKLEAKCKDFDKETAKTYVMNFKANHNPPKLGHDLPATGEIDVKKMSAKEFENILKGGK